MREVVVAERPGEVAPAARDAVDDAPAPDPEHRARESAEAHHGLRHHPEPAVLGAELDGVHAVHPARPERERRDAQHGGHHHDERDAGAVVAPSSRETAYTTAGSIIMFETPSTNCQAR